MCCLSIPPMLGHSTKWYGRSVESTYFLGGVNALYGMLMAHRAGGINILLVKRPIRLGPSTAVHRARRQVLHIMMGCHFQKYYSSSSWLNCAHSCTRINVLALLCSGLQAFLVQGVSYIDWASDLSAWPRSKGMCDDGTVSERREESDVTEKK